MRAWRAMARWLPGVLVAAVTLLAFLPSLQGEFLNWDDDENFLFNPHYRGLGWTQIRWMFTATHSGLYIPVTWLTLGLDSVLWGMDPRGYHLTSVVLHAINALLFYRVARRLLAAGFATPPHPALSPAGGEGRGEGSGTIAWAAGVAALIFSVHPLRVESVAWVTERRDVVVGLFVLLTLAAYLRAWQEGAAGRLHRGWYWIAVGCFALALLSKSIAVGLPVVLLALDLFPLRRAAAPPGAWARRLAALAAEKLPFLALAAGISAVTLCILMNERLLASRESLDLGQRLALTGYGLAFYLWKFLVPWPLSPIYTLFHPVLPWSARLLIPAGAVTLLTAAVILARRRWPAGLVAWVSCVALVLPVLGLFHSGPQIAADRYTYLASLPLALLLGSGVAWCWQAGRAGALSPALARAVGAAAAALLIGLIALTTRQIAVWQDSVTLWRHAAWVEPASDIPVFYLGWALRDKGRLAEAREHWSRSLDRVPPDLRALRARFVTEIGVVEQRAGDHAEAARRFREGLTLDAAQAVAAIRLGLALSAQGAGAEAERAFAAALPLVIGPRPPIWELRAAIAEVPVTQPEARGRLAFALALRLQQRGALEEAGAQYRAGLALLPRHAEAWNNLGVTYALRRRPDEALEAFLQALRIQPGYPEACQNGRLAAQALGVTPAEIESCSPGRG
ncbi:MAG: tetratricopeptide repeat protein [candidate division NC10 bacterium]